MSCVVGRERCVGLEVSERIDDREGGSCLSICLYIFYLSYLFVFFLLVWFFWLIFFIFSLNIIFCREVLFNFLLRIIILLFFFCKVGNIILLINEGIVRLILIGMVELRCKYRGFIIIVSKMK